MSDFEMIRTLLNGMVPFSKHIGVEVLAIADGESTARLVESPDNMNHIGTPHAGSIFSLGESTTGAAMAGAFAERLQTLRPVAADAHITYKKVAQGTVTAKAKVKKPSSELNAILDKDGKVVFEVDVSIYSENDNEPAAEMTVLWHVKTI